MTTLYVSNIPFALDAAELKKLFSQVGVVNKIFMPLDAGSGRKRGFAFVDIDDKSATNAIFKLHGHSVQGRSLLVTLAPEGRRRTS